MKKKRSRIFENDADSEERNKQASLIDQSLIKVNEDNGNESALVDKGSKRFYTSVYDDKPIIGNNSRPPVYPHVIYNPLQTSQFISPPKRNPLQSELFFKKTQQPNSVNVNTQQPLVYVKSPQVKTSGSQVSNPLQQTIHREYYLPPSLSNQH